MKISNMVHQHQTSQQEPKAHAVSVHAVMADRFAMPDQMSGEISSLKDGVLKNNLPILRNENLHAIHVAIIPNKTPSCNPLTRHAESNA